MQRVHHPVVDAAVGACGIVRQMRFVTIRVGRIQARHATELKQEVPHVDGNQKGIIGHMRSLQGQELS
jgi:hypothetical protein